ncbi:MAG: hypothetical protein RL021_1746 [Bacteroidota bacterium]|jgi:predicted phosphoribosyltransferase
MLSNTGCLFHDRETAAKELVAELDHLKSNQGIVLAVPRGGIPLGRVISDRLSWPMEPLMIKKLGHPQNPEYAIGAVSIDEVFLDGAHPEVSAGYIQRETERLQLLLQQRQKLFLQGRKPAAVNGKTVLIVDDGAATGKTLVAAVKSVRRSEPKRIIVAVPVASAEAVERLERVADEVVCLATPDDFFGVGQFYELFPQVEDEEVRQLLSLK